MANLSLQKEGRQRSLRAQQKIVDDDDSDDLSQASEGGETEGGRIILSRAKRNQKLSWLYIVAYAAPMIGAGGMNFTLTTFAAYFYTDIMGLNAATVGNIQLALMLMFATSEPLFGWVSDITGGWVRKHLGRRKPYLVVSAFLHALTFFCLMGPPASLNQSNGLVQWAFGFAILLGLSWGCNEVTYQALGSQLTFDYDERTKLQAVVVSVVAVGSTSCGLLNGVLGTSLGASFEATRYKFSIIASIYALLFFVGTILMVAIIKEEAVEAEYAEGRNLSVKEWIGSGVESAKQMFLNVPFFLLIVSYSCALMAGAVTPMMLPYFSKHVVRSHFATEWAPLFFTASAVVGMSFWVFLGSSYVRMEKKWRFLIAGAWMSLFLGLPSLIVRPGDDAIFVVFSILAGFGMGGYFATPEAMKPDVVDYDEFRTGARHEARFAGVFMYFANIGAGFALEVVLIVMSQLGYDGSKQLGDPEPPEVVTAIRCFYGSTLLVMMGLIVPAMLFYPITKKKHQEILVAVQKRMDGEYAADPLYGGEPLPPFENIPFSRRVATTDFIGGQSEAETTFLQEVGMEVGSLAGIHGDRMGIRNIP